MSKAEVPCLLTIRDLCARWKVSRTTLWRQVRDRRLRRVLIGGQVRFRVEDVEKAEVAR